ncbi:MAG TPA: PhzF family phenazine biosynthesis protein [Chloroflexota bacterium]|nr:PhzF family phenazine biosynthesis protein [Chloroflexota bacterium]
MSSGAAAGRRYAFHQVDVFTDVLFGGNPLAVFPDAAGLSDAEMQAIAREMNLSETTFVLAPELPGAAAKVRIFTPGRELPFAGHPTLGTAYVLASLGRLPTPHAGVAEAVLEEGIGAVPVRLERGGTFVWMGQRDATFGPEVVARGALAGALGLAERDLLDGAPVRVGSTGNAFLYVALRDRAAVDRVTLDARALLAVFDDPECHGVFVFAPDGAAEDGAVRVYSRMLGYGEIGIGEDAATGSASGPLGAYLVEHGLATPVGEERVVRIVSEQGTRMGRRSLVHIRLRAAGARATDIRVGGGVVPVLEGTLTL